MRPSCRTTVALQGLCRSFLSYPFLIDIDYIRMSSNIVREGLHNSVGDIGHTNVLTASRVMQSFFKKIYASLATGALVSMLCLPAGKALAETEVQRERTSPVNTSAAMPLRAAQTFFSNVAQHTSDVVVEAMLLIGVRYQWGGNTPKSGMDCSGFVRYVFQDTLGLLLPRRAIDMSRVGRKVSRSNLQPGDLVFFNTIRRTVSHVGIYIGDNKFVHSPATGKTIRIDRLANSYWKARYTGARRIIMAAQ